MGILKRLRWLFGPMPIEIVSSGLRLSLDVSPEDMYASQPALRTVTDFIARNVASLPLKCYVRGNDGRKRVRDSPLALLLDRPNPHQTRYDFVSQTVMELLLYDRFVWAVGPDDTSDSGYRIQVIPNAWIVSDGGATPWDVDWIFVSTMGHGGVKKIDRENLVIEHGYTPGDPKNGSSAIEALKATLREQAEAQAFRRDTWERGMRITGFLSKPPSVERWDQQARDRFVKDVKETWSKHGSNAGGTPFFEDGITYHSVDFNPRERDWLQGVQLAREEVTAVYHVPFATIWSSTGQTFASAKDNARQLYAETLSPYLAVVEQRINAELKPKLGGDPDEYAEFDLRGKLRGNFDDQISSLQTATGAPNMTRAEARDELNLPFIEGTDELIVPLNVIAGGLASPTDTDPTVERYGASSQDAIGGVTRVLLVNGQDPAQKAQESDSEPSESQERRTKAQATDDEQDEYVGIMRKFFARQRRSVLAAIGAAKADDGGDPAWWDAQRWNDELTDDLLKAALDGSAAAARRALKALGLDPDAYDVDRTKAFIEALVRRRAEMINADTLGALQASIDGEYSDDAEQSEPAGVFDVAEESRSNRIGRTLATTVAAWAVCEAGKQCAPKEAYKVWVTGPNPRPSHAEMNGATAEINGKFSNGADWPGDASALDAADVCNCNCTVEIVIP